ncbi:MAG: FAD-binding oxidoreductase [Planctomycetes bacterium]|nr:FAD-binding oxidoreductase [Planctomycetota bacterium]
MTQRPTSRAELQDLLRSRRHPRVRLLGSGSRPAMVRRVPSDATFVSLAAMDRIERLEPGDLTCSVQPGVLRHELDLELRRHGLELPCAGTGTIGGLFAADDIGPLAPGAPAPRNLLLGLEGVLADGTPFKSGARVVKSVAGFDVHKLFVGSQGRLFAATLLHLKLRPLPRASCAFGVRNLSLADALAKFAGLRQEPAGVHQVTLLRDAAGACMLAGRLGGRASHLAALRTRFSLAESADAGPLQLHAEAGHELITGIVCCSRLNGLLADLPAAAPFLMHGGGRFWTVLPTPQVAPLLSRMPTHDAHAVAVSAADSPGTALDPGAATLTTAIRHALDPRGVLA